ncbi:unnamed protein product, partial [Adineta ricciae]
QKFIRLTVKTDDRSGRFKKRQPIAEGQQQRQQKQSEQLNVVPTSRRSQRAVNQPPRVPPRHIKHKSIYGTHRVETPVTTDNISYTHTDNEEPDHYLTDHSNNLTRSGDESAHHSRSGLDPYDMDASFGDMGLSISSKPLSKVQKLSVQTVLNGSFPRVTDKPQTTSYATGSIRNGKSNETLNHTTKHDSSLPFFNSSYGASGRLNQTIGQYHHRGAAAATARTLRKERNRDGSVKSTSREIDPSPTHHLYQQQTAHNTSNNSSIVHTSQSHPRAKSFLTGITYENLTRVSPFPMKPSDALMCYGSQLTEFERKEILEYHEVYFLGLEAEKLPVTNIKEYDDENGSYIKVNKDHICYRYEILETLGKGSFGLVLRCYDHKKKETVALKIIRNKKRFQQQGLVEVNILMHLKSLDSDNSLNIVHIKDHFYFRAHLCITFEILGINLYELIRKNNYQGFSIHLVRRFANSLLQCLRVTFREKIIHCDLKPENIILRQKGSSSIKVIDFGSGCFQSQRIYTYIQSRFYRAPEIILGIPYTPAIDMWSLGCILVELFTGHPVFPGENEQEQLAMIIEVIDSPPLHVLDQGSRRKLFFDSKGNPRSASAKTMKKRRPASRPLAQILRTTDNNFVDFIRRCLEWDPLIRLTPEEGLHHPWMIESKLKRSTRESRIQQRRKKDPNSTIESCQFYLPDACFTTFSNASLVLNPSDINTNVFTCPSSCYTIRYLSNQQDYPIYGNETYSGNSLICKAAYHDGRIMPWNGTYSTVSVQNNLVQSSTFSNSLRNGILSGKSFGTNYYVYRFLNNRVNETSIPDIAIEHRQYLYSQEQPSSITCRSKTDLYPIRPVEIDQGWKHWTGNRLKYFTFPHNYTREQSLAFCSNNNATLMYWANSTEQTILQNLLTTTIYDLFRYQRRIMGSNLLTFFIGLKQINQIKQWESNAIPFNQSLQLNLSSITIDGDYCTVIQSNGVDPQSIQILSVRCNDTTIMGYPLCRLLPSINTKTSDFIYRLETDTSSKDLSGVIDFCAELGGYPIYANNAYEWQLVQEIMLGDSSFIGTYAYTGLISPTKQVTNAYWMPMNTSYNSTLDYVWFASFRGTDRTGYHLSRASDESYYGLYDINPFTVLSTLRFCRKGDIRSLIADSPCDYKACVSKCQNISLPNHSDDARFGLYACIPQNSLVGIVYTQSFPVQGDFIRPNLPMDYSVALRRPFNQSVALSFTLANTSLSSSCFEYMNFDRTLYETIALSCSLSNTNNLTMNGINLRQNLNTLVTVAFNDRRMSGHHTRFIDYQLYDNRCRSQGIYHPYVNQCICAPGFYGDQCQYNCPAGYYGQTCDFNCKGDDDYCKGLSICLPDPYGCSCYTGWYGTYCNISCPSNLYGPGCSYQCSCSNCDRFTGQCNCTGTECYQELC